MDATPLSAPMTAPPNAPVVDDPTHLSGCPAPAKINLFLHVVGRRADGYHLLQTAFRLLDWGDSLDFSLRTDGRICRVNELPGVAEADDLGVDRRFAAARRDAADFAEREIRAFGFDDESGDAHHFSDAQDRPLRAQPRAKALEDREAVERGGHECAFLSG